MIEKLRRKRKKIVFALIMFTYVIETHSDCSPIAVVFPISRVLLRLVEILMILYGLLMLLISVD